MMPNKLSDVDILYKTKKKPYDKHKILKSRYLSIKPTIYKSSRQEMLCIKDILKNFAKFMGK